MELILVTVVYMDNQVRYHPGTSFTILSNLIVEDV